MPGIYFIGDTHFGKKYPFLKDYKLLLSERNYDVINNCESIVKSAIENVADCVVFLGDVYEHQSNSPTIRKIVRERVFEPLNRADIQVIIIGGNHDSIRYLERGADIEDLVSYSNCSVFTTFDTRIIETKSGERVGFVLLPFIHYDVICDLARKNLEQFRNMPPDQNYANAQAIIKDFVNQMVEEIKDCDRKILVGHYYLHGAKVHDTQHALDIYGEFTFTREMIQRESFDLVVFGHVHLYQEVWGDGRIIIPGSVDRIDMGERDSDKYYITYDPASDHVSKTGIPCRTLIKIDIVVPQEESDITTFILEKLPTTEEIKDAQCKVTIECEKGKEISINKQEIEKQFSGAFYADIKYEEQSEVELQHLRELNLDPLSLYDDYLQQKYQDHELFEDLKREGRDVLTKEFIKVDVTATGSLSIKAVEMRDFNMYGSRSSRIDFEKDLYAITGPTGAGKSSILDAITLSLYKRNSRTDSELKLEDILHGKGAFVSVEIDIGDHVLQVRRANKAPKLFIKLGNEELFPGLSIQEKEKHIESIIGYDYDGFNSSFFIRQQELQVFSSDNSGDRQKRLAGLFKLDIFRKAKETCMDKYKDAETKKNELEGRIMGSESMLKEFPEKKKQFAEKKKAKKQLETDLKAKTKATKDLQKEIETLLPDASKYLRLGEANKSMDTQIKEKKEEIARYENLQKKPIELQAKLKDFDDLDAQRDKRLDQLDQLREKDSTKDKFNTNIKTVRSSIATTRDQYQRRIVAIQKQIDDKQSKIEATGGAMNKTEAFGVLKDGGRLEERLERVRTIEIPLAQAYNDDGMLKSFTKTERQTVKEIEEQEPREATITKDVFIKDELEEDVKILLESIASAQKEMDEAITVDEARLKKLEAQLKQLGLDKDFGKLIKAIKVELGDINERVKKRDDIKRQLAAIKDYSELIMKLETDLESMDNTYADNEKDQEALKPSYDMYTEKSAEAGKMLIENEKMTQEINGMEREINVLQDFIERIQKVEAEQAQARNDLQDQIKVLAIYKLLKDDIFHLNGVPKFAMEKILPAIQIRASEILSDLTDGKLSIITFKPLEGGRRVGFDIAVYDGEQDREASTFSGGEKTQINAAIRFAIIEKIAEIPDTSGAVFRKSDTLFIDEGDLGTLDDESARRIFVDKILELKSVFKKIILITHLEDVAERFPNRIRIEKDKAGKSIIVE